LFLISGEYLVSVKFNDQHIPDSPFKVYLAPSTGDIQKLNVSDLQEHGLQVKLLCCFSVILNDGDRTYIDDIYTVSAYPRRDGQAELSRFVYTP